MIELFNSEEFKEYSLTDKEYITGEIYYLLHKEHIVYIGKTVNMDSRISAHRNNKEFDRIFHKTVPFNVLDETEKVEIRKYFPIYNSQYIEKKDYNHPDYRIFLEFDDYYIFRTIGKIPKSNVYIKGNIYLIITDTKYSLCYRFLDISTNKLGKEIIKFYNGNYTYSEELHDFVHIPEPVIEKPIKVKKRYSTKTTYSIDEVNIPDSYIFPVGKYKGKAFGTIQDDNYKCWFYEHVWLNS